MAFHEILIRGVDLKVEWPDGRVEYRHIYAIDWEVPENNDFRVVNQFPVHGQNDRRPDIVIFVNGLPLVVFELKNPYSEKPTVEDAFNQVQHYTYEISATLRLQRPDRHLRRRHHLHGVWTAGREWYSPWKSIDGFEIEPNTTGSMKTLVEGLFPKDRLLAYIRDFIVFESVNEKITKKGARYHQFFAVRLAAEESPGDVHQIKTSTSSGSVRRLDPASLSQTPHRRHLAHHRLG
jgi:type I restriction enzyme, R subunit